MTQEAHGVDLIGGTPPSPRSMAAELELQRKESARLMQQLSSAIQRAAGRDSTVRRAARSLGEFAHKRPGVAILMAVAAAYVAGRVWRSR